MKRLGAPVYNILAVQNNLATTYEQIGRHSEKALGMRRDVYSGYVKLLGKQHADTLRAAHNYALSLAELQRFDEAKSLWSRTLPVARVVLGESHILTLKMRKRYSQSLYKDAGATLEDLREAVTTLEETEQTARRVLGAAHPLTGGMGESLQAARAKLRAHETPSPGSAYIERTASAP